LCNLTKIGKKKYIKKYNKIKMAEKEKKNYTIINNRGNTILINVTYTVSFPNVIRIIISHREIKTLSTSSIIPVIF